MRPRTACALAGLFGSLLPNELSTANTDLTPTVAPAPDAEATPSTFARPLAIFKLVGSRSPVTMTFCGNVMLPSIPNVAVNGPLPSFAVKVIPVLSTVTN